jgi:hypothetical protein
VGLSPWNFNLLYHSGAKRVVWRVMNVENRGNDGSSGEILTIDGTQGAVLDKSGYRFIS